MAIVSRFVHKLLCVCRIVLTCFAPVNYLMHLNSLIEWTTKLVISVFHLISNAHSGLEIGYICLYSHYRMCATILCILATQCAYRCFCIPIMFVSVKSSTYCNQLFLSYIMLRYSSRFTATAVILCSSYSYM